ncbi:MAG TPA: sugar phosphate isomerase/epimerase family protein [Candidatus Bipolaricaulis anaerobius]|nr:sugar phosphate isomerase/epimerase family protein [Candidatus Bipolaricaulis anaerobius]HQM37953.1 sugar phosphate isomerase/epimerase family protein [Candidatus Bipolaricaulis anaerobius]
MDRHQLGLSTFLWPGMDVERWLELALELGLGGVELRADPRAAGPGDLSPAVRLRLRNQLAERGLWSTVHAPIYDLNLASPLRAIAAASVEEVIGALDLASDLGSRLLVVHPGHVDSDYLPLAGERDLAWRRFSLAMEVILARAARKGVQVALENKQRPRGWDMVHTPAEHVQAVDRFPGLGACLDFGHLHTTGGDPTAYVAALGERLVHVHLHDNRGERDEHLPLGRGSLPWRAAWAALSSAGYRGPIVLEIPDPDGLRESVAVLERG